jgi:hypothetical protein
MVENLLVGDQLTPEMIGFGENLVEQLDKSEVPILGAYWVLMPEPKVWRLVVASPLARTLGPKSVYRKVQAAIKKMGTDRPMVDLGDISVVDDKATLFLGFRKVASTSPRAKGVRFTRGVIDGQSVEDAYIYQLT